MTTFAQACASNTKTVISADHAQRRWTLLKLFGIHSLGSHVRLPSMADGYDRGHTGESGFKTGP